MPRTIAAIEHRDERPVPSPHTMIVSPAEKALLLLIRELDHGELTLVVRGGLPTYATHVKQSVHFGQWKGGE